MGLITTGLGDPGRKQKPVPDGGRLFRADPGKNEAVISRILDDFIVGNAMVCLK